MKLLLAATTLLSSLGSSYAFPSRAADCPAGIPAVSGSHLESSATQFRTGTLEDVALQVSINQVPLDASNPMDVLVGETLTWSIALTDDEAVLERDRRPFKGFLFRLEGDDIDASEGLVENEDNTNVQSASVCPSKVLGLCHTNNEEKTFVSGEFTIDEESLAMAVDVTVVIENQGGKSAYFYSNYRLNAIVESTMDEMDMDIDMDMDEMPPVDVDEMPVDMNMTKPTGNSTDSVEEMEMDEMEDIDVDGNATAVEAEDEDEDEETEVAAEDEDEDDDKDDKDEDKETQVAAEKSGGRVRGLQHKA